MILKALYDYYHRSKDLPSMGFEKVGISYIIVIDNTGKFKRIASQLDKNKPKEYCVHKKCRKSSDITSNILWDNATYVLGLASDRGEHQKFIEKCKILSNLNPESVEIKALCLFYEKGGVEQLQGEQEFENIKKNPKSWISFQIEGDLNIIPVNCKDILLDDCSKNIQGVCLVTGKVTSLVQTAGKFMLEGNNAHVLTFQTNSGYDSYGKSQCYNAPIGQDTEFAITTALKTLTHKDSRNQYRINDNRTFVFWASNNSDTSIATEESFISFLDKESTPNDGLGKVIKTFKSVWSGISPTSDSDRFYLLGLAPVSKGRHAVVYWNECTLKEFAGKVLKHFEDMEIVDGRKEPKPYMGIYSILSSVTLGGKINDVQTNLPEAVLKSVVQGLPYPYILFSSCIRRIRAEISKKINGKFINSCSIQRMAIIKAYLNRLNDNNNKKIEIMLDKENTNSGYICGRLFAVLEYTQKSANKINTIRERYMNAASATPAAVFATLLNLNVHHVEKFEHEGKKIYIETMKQEIVSMLPAEGFPAHLDLQDQGRFFVGYYHQMQDLYTKKEKETKE